MVATEAGKVMYLEGHVSWLQAAIKAAKAENMKDKDDAMKKLKYALLGT